MNHDADPCQTQPWADTEDSIPPPSRHPIPSQRSKDRSAAEQLWYPLLYGHHEHGLNIPLPRWALSMKTGNIREKGVRRVNAPLPPVKGVICTNCGVEGHPIQPLFDLDLSSALIPMRYTTLRTFLSKHKAEFPARYVLTKSHRKIRLLTADEVKQIRRAVLRGPGKDFW